MILIKSKLIKHFKMDLEKILKKITQNEDLEDVITIN